MPVFGEAADVINGAWYLAEGNYVDGGLSFSSDVPLAGYAATAAKGAKYADEAIDAVKTVDKAADAAADAKKATKAADEVVPPAAPKPKAPPKPAPPAKPKEKAGAGNGSKGDGPPETTRLGPLPVGRRCRRQPICLAVLYPLDRSVVAAPSEVAPPL
ncbi:hypothetical protein [Streptomyces sp. NPDC050263]|uniref:hypothetical protein n=1 Tax=Streptomyces sp. NPDC050263 TaxID=3155037 RepID=UPI00341AE055